MLRPATPLTILLFAAFVLLIISIISTPIVRGIPLATIGDISFGVFGFCHGNTCSKVEIGYDLSGVLSASQDASFDLSSGTRTTLSAILVVHPVAALFTLIMLILAASAHFHSPSHSPRFLLGIFILSILTLVLALLAFLIDVLIFVPHMAWGSYIVLAATILIAASGIVSCAMRRTLVSRKARKRRIAENAEMNGENFYARQGPDPVAMTGANNMIVNGGPGADKMPAFATFEMAKKDSERTSDERIPLTTRTPTDSSPTNGQVGPVMNDRYGGQNRPGDAPARDQYGNVIPRPPPGAYGSGSRDPSADPSFQRQYSNGSINSRGRGGMPPPQSYRGGYRGGYTGDGRGRGGYGPPPRGGYGGRGGYGPPRGGYGGPYRGDSAMMRGGRGGPPPGYGAQSSRAGYGMPAVGGYGPRRSSSQPRYDGYGAPPAAEEYSPYNPDDTASTLPKAESPPPLPGLDNEGMVGQAVEMDATTGSPQHAPRDFGQYGNIRESDGDVAGMVGLQQQRLQERSTMASESSHYASEEPYVPPRQEWAKQNDGSSPHNISPPAELTTSNAAAPGHKRTSSGDNYYEDMDPRFSQPPPNLNLAPINPVPSRHLGLDGSTSYEDLQSGARSPAADSDRSNFTSVSQRGVNPRWTGGYGAPMPNRRPVNAPPPQRDVLSNNPDFELPNTRSRKVVPQRAGVGSPVPGMVPNSPYPGGAL